MISYSNVWNMWAVPTFSDPEQFSDALTAYNLTVNVIGTAPFRAEWTMQTVERLACIHGKMSAAITHSFSNQINLVFLDQEKPFMIRNGIEITPHDLVIWPSHVESHTRIAAPHGWRMISLTTAELNRAIRLLTHRVPPVAIDARVERIRPPAMLLRQLRHLHRAAMHGPKNTTSRMISEELLNVVVQCLDVDVAEPRVNATSKLRVIRQFCEVVEANQEWPLLLTDLCAMINVTARTLQRHTQDYFNVSPREYIMLRRMNLVRHALAEADPASTTVGDIAARYGFVELGRFAGRYRQLFGQTPSARLQASK